MGKHPFHTTIVSLVILSCTWSVNAYRLLPFGFPELLIALMVRSCLVQLVLDKVSSVRCSHLV